MSIFWVITENLAVLAENWIIFDFYTRFHDQKRNTIAQKIIYYASILLVSLVVILIDSFTPFSGMMTFLCIGLIILYGILFLKGSIFSKFFLPIATFGMILIINISLNAVCALFLDRQRGELLYQQDTVRFFSILITKFLLFFATRILLAIFKKGINLKKQEWFTMSGILLISLFIGTAIFNIAHELSFSYVMCIVGIFCIHLFVFIMLSQISKQNEKMMQLSLLELQTEQQKQMLSHMDIMQNKIRSCNHDHLNHLLCLQGMLHEAHYTEAEGYLSELVQKNPEVQISRLQIPDHFLRVILTVKMEQCKQKNIAISLKTDDATPKCDSSDLCVLLSNLLDNAIEASEKVQSPRIEVILSKKKDYYTVVVKNRIEESVLQTNAALKTTKESKLWHGIGIQSVREIVNRYHGLMEYYESGNWFIANIWLRET